MHHLGPSGLRLYLHVSHDRFAVGRSVSILTSPAKKQRTGGGDEPPPAPVERVLGHGFGFAVGGAQIGPFLRQIRGCACPWRVRRFDVGDELLEDLLHFQRALL